VRGASRDMSRTAAGSTTRRSSDDFRLEFILGRPCSAGVVHDGFEKSSLFWISARVGRRPADIVIVGHGRGIVRCRPSL
jgi:hypothetical protein